MRWLIALAALSCASHKPLEPAMFSPQLASDRLVVKGRIISLAPDSSGGVRTVIVDKNGRPYKVLIIRNTRAGMTMEGGDEVTAWCRGAGDNLVADSARVDKNRAKRPQGAL